MERYLDAVIDNNPDSLPIAPGAKFTEDGQRLLVGDGLWNTMKAKGDYRLFVTDVPAQQVTVLASIFEDHREATESTPALLALRLRLKSGQIAEIEQMVVRDEDAARRVDGSTPRPGLLADVPRGSRMSRADLISVSDMYFSGMQQNDGLGDYPFADDCDRLENGGRSTNAPTPPGQTRPDPKTSSSYSGQWSCLEQFQSGLINFVHRIRDRRFVAVDEERGLTFAFGFFDHPGGETRTFQTPDGRTVSAGPVQPWTWYIAEVFKVHDDNIHEIEAFLMRVPYGMNSGWSTWEQGMSDAARDVTME
ncbi:MAG TPA: hypothetical protein GX696_02900 [Pseudomonadaceae bacterium]|nr:hypothetical protein [Pseudomonadaceae bacterium]